MKLNKSFYLFFTIFTTFSSSFLITLPMSLKYDFLWTNLSTDYKQVINWNDSNFVKKLIVDDQGIVFSDFTKTEIIALLPNSKVNELTIPKSVIKITGYLDATPLVGTEPISNPVVKGAFESNNYIQSVKFLGDKTNYIGSKSFSNMRNLVSVELSQSIIHIDNYAFYNCVNLNSINLNNVEIIGYSSFENAFQNTYTPENKINRLYLDNLIFLGDNAFKNTHELNEVYFTNNVNLKYLGISSFENSGISNIVDMSSCIFLERIDNFTFKNSLIKGIITPKNLKTLGQGCFEESRIELANLSASKIENFPIWLFKNAKLLQWVIIPKNTLKTLDIEVFYNCKFLKIFGTEDDLKIKWLNNSNILFSSIEEKIIFPSSIVSVDTSAFRNTAVAIADLSKSKVKELPYNLFLDCLNLKSVILPSTLENIKNKCFNNNPKLTEINFSNLTNLQIIGAGNFVNCKLDNIDLSHNLKLTNINSNNIDEPAFSNIENLTSVKLPTSIKTTISNNMFTRKNSSNPDNPIVIDNIGYYNTEGVLTVIDRVLNVGQTAINLGYDRMKKVNLSEMKNLTKIVGKTFANNRNLTEVVLPAKALNWEFLPNIVNYNEAPFANNTNLQKIIFKNFNKENGTDYPIPNGGFSEIGNNTKNQITNILNSFSSIDENNKAQLINLQKWQTVQNQIDIDSLNSNIFTGWYSNPELTNPLNNNGKIDANTTLSYKKHNNVLWTYKAENGGIWIYGSVNIYRANKGNNNLEDRQIYFDEENVNHKIEVILEVIPHKL